MRISRLATIDIARRRHTSRHRRSSMLGRKRTCRTQSADFCSDDKRSSADAVNAMRIRTGRPILVATPNRQLVTLSIRRRRLPGVGGHALPCGRKRGYFWVSHAVHLLTRRCRLQSHQSFPARTSRYWRLPRSRIANKAHHGLLRLK